MGMKSNSGFFHGTTGSSKNDTPVKKLGNDFYDSKKTTKYLLNEIHAVGESKVKFFKDVLGYSSSDSKIFHKIEMNELDVVKLIENFNGLQAGTIGIIVFKYDDENYKVEFFDEEGDTIDVLTIHADLLELHKMK